MGLYIPLPCCECTASTNPCDLPCLVSAVATISGSINVVGSGSGAIAICCGFPVSPAPYLYDIDFSLNDEVTLDSSGNGQTNSVIALLDQQFAYAPGTNCLGTECSGSTVVNGVPTFDLSCPANVCIGGQQYQIGTALQEAENNIQSSNCNYNDGIDTEDHINDYSCNATYPLDSIANPELSYVACSYNEFAFSFEIGTATLVVSTIQAGGYIELGQIFIDNLDPRPLYAGCSGPTGFSSKTITGSMNIVIDRVIGYINENSECVAP